MNSWFEQMREVFMLCNNFFFFLSETVYTNFKLEVFSQL